MDDDLGRWGGGVNRPGFERVLAAVREERFGAAPAIGSRRLGRLATAATGAP
jgi:hypothetical protein